MSKRIGLLGGISYRSTIDYYRLLMEKYYEHAHDYHYPEVVIASVDFQRFTDYEDRGQIAEYKEYILETCESLVRANADVIAFTANSPHRVFNEIARAVTVPMISIVEATCDEAAKRKYKRVLLLGIKFTMQSTFYQDVFRSRGIEVITPHEPDQDEINRIIFDELSIADVRDTSRKQLIDIIAHHPADGVILGCTELPMILRDRDAIGLLNTVEIHVDAILRFAL